MAQRGKGQDVSNKEYTFILSAGEFSKWEEGGEKNGAANKDMEMKTNPDGTTEVYNSIHISICPSIYLSI